MKSKQRLLWHAALAATLFPVAAFDAVAQPVSAASAVSSASAVSAQAPLQDFTAWKAQFRTQALESGISADTFDRAFADVAPDPSVIERDQTQPEFVNPVWEYLDAELSAQRIQRGRELLQANAATFAAVSARYGVAPTVLAAIWGIESNYGQDTGELQVVRSLATLGYEGRRRAFAQTQLIAALQIVQHGDVTADQLLGSWAGAMGQTQFIPSTYNTYAVDFDGDGKRNIWTSSADALGSAANLLHSLGWHAGAPIAVEVTLPDGFDYHLADLGVKKAVREWYRSGVRAVGDAPASAQPDDNASVILPAGYRGPAFLVFDNFRAVLGYNNSTSYALAAALLAERYEGRGQIRASWPKDDPPLSRSDLLALQALLDQQGYDAGEPDGVAGPATRAAIRAYQTRHGLPADGYASVSLLDRLRR
ncbi:lytic murein transglycosylase [Trinickia sp. LjRoot230]|uniref:lytic murein transglycosylase n=1 Tax=Trinickia sp. LjRoot230 TaxID=3342288 RepID=UPI003ED04F26